MQRYCNSQYLMHEDVAQVSAENQRMQTCVNVHFWQFLLPNRKSSLTKDPLKISQKRILYKALHFTWKTIKDSEISMYMRDYPLTVTYLGTKGATVKEHIWCR